MQSSFDYDFIVIGAGSGGVRAARFAATLGAKVAVIEKSALGGTCVNVGCVPKKLMVYASEYRQHFKHAQSMGWNIPQDQISHNWHDFIESKNNEILRLNGIYQKILEGSGVTIINGQAEFKSSNEINVDNKTYSAKYVLIATGGKPRTLPAPGGEHALTSNDIFYLPERPKHLTVLGGGYIAVEFASVFNSFGSQVDLLYRGELFLRGFDNDIREFVLEQMKQAGVNIHFNVSELSIEKNSDKADAEYQVAFKTKEQEKQLSTDKVLSAIGRIPLVDELNLKAADIELNEFGAIMVNDNFETSCPNVFAIGDVIDRVTLTPVALAEGMAVAKYLFDDVPVAVSYDLIPSAVFCQPNIGTVGLTEQQALKQYPEVDVYQSTFKSMIHSFEPDGPRTLMKLIVEPTSQKVLGLHIAGAEAGEITQGFAVALKAGATKKDFDNTIGIHPTIAEELVTMRTPSRQAKA